MSSTELLLFPLALLASASRPPAVVACPASDGGVRLTDGTVYDGPIADNAILAPDSERKIRGGTVNTWPVGDVYKAGRQVYLSCQYAKRTPVIVQVKRPVKMCHYTSRESEHSLACR